MEAAQFSPPSIRLAYLGAIHGFGERSTVYPSVSNCVGPAAYIDRLEPIAQASNCLPRMRILFSESVLDRMRQKNAEPVTQRMFDFFSRLGSLSEAVNSHVLADCKFFYFDQSTGAVHPIHLTTLQPIHGQSQELPPTDLDAQNEDSSSTLAVERRMENLYDVLSQNYGGVFPDLLVSDHPEEVKTALHQGMPAILARLPDSGHSDLEPNRLFYSKADVKKPLLVALDFDCTLFGGAGEWLFVHGLSHLPQSSREKMYHRVEQLRANSTLGPGPMLHFVQALVGLKKLLMLLPEPLDSQLRFALITARSAQTKERIHHNLQTHIPDYDRLFAREDVPETVRAEANWFEKHEGIHFMNGSPKLSRLQALDADLFLDDSGTHTHQSCEFIPTGQVLWGPGHQDGENVFSLHPALVEEQPPQTPFRPRIHLLPHTEAPLPRESSAATLDAVTSI